MPTRSRGRFYTIPVSAVHTADNVMSYRVLIPSRAVQACLDYVMHLPGVVVNSKKVVAAGVSNGGYMAAPIASRYTVYTHAMLIHAMCVYLVSKTDCTEPL